MRKRNKVVFYAAKIRMILSLVQKSYALNAIKWVI
jgi:hypothetical protein